LITSAEASAQFAAARPVAAAPTAALVNALLFLTILSSPLVFIEPAPYEFLAALLGVACVLARVPFDRRLLPLLILLVLFNVSGAIALAGVLDGEKSVRYASISVFMAASAIVFACLFSEDRVNIGRLQLMRRTYIVAAFVVAILGSIGYLNVIPGAAKLFATLGRANGTFKDANVFAPFLILPLLMLAYSLFTQGIKLRRVVAFLGIALGLLLSFSRGAWAHFAVSALVMLGLMFVTAPDMRTRARLMALSIVAIAAFVGLIVFALSFDAIGDMFKERARLIQPYDAGSNMGRFNLQQRAVIELLEHPFGLGPYEFVRLYGLQQHNTYLQAFLVYGWVGGLSYLVLVLLTLAIGLRAALTRTPWQPFAITAFATFVGVVGESFVIDTDHWRHYFLLLGIIWGTFAATMRQPSAG
jgi:O-antigen ligase